MDTKLPRQVWIASLTQEGIQGSDIAAVVNSAIAKMERTIAHYQPDIVCLPEAFHVTGLPNGKPPLTESAEKPPGPTTAPFAEFASKHSCYVICPIYTEDDGHYYNAAVILDRQGELVGEYRKIHVTEGEIDDGIAPGPIDPPVFATDFGPIGVQICFDIEWPSTWLRLGDKGAEIIFWPSAFAGGRMLDALAWQTRCCIVSSTRKDTTKICDVTGEPLAVSGRWSSWGVCAPVNLEKAFLHTWPYVRRFGEVQAKYGRKVRIHSLHEEEFTVIESLSPDLKIADLMAEFGFKTHREHIRSATRAQDEFRQNME